MMNLVFWCNITLEMMSSASYNIGKMVLHEYFLDVCLTSFFLHFHVIKRILHLLLFKKTCIVF